MRDMLVRLQTISEEQEDEDSDFCGPEYDVDKGTLSPQQAVIFENPQNIDNVLVEAQSIRKEIDLIHLEVQRLGAHNERYATSIRRLTLLKRDSDSMARGIHQRLEAVYGRLQALGKEKNQLEEKQGRHSAVARIALTQYDTLTRAFQDVMGAYNKAEEIQRNSCRSRFQRQASIMGKNISCEELDVIVEKGGEGWSELSQSLQPQDARSCRSALCDIKNRHKELVELEARLKEIHELFQQMALLVEEQGSLLNNIEANVRNTQEHIDKFDYHIKRAIRYKKKNPFLQCCPCLPCSRNN